MCLRRKCTSRPNTGSPPKTTQAQLPLCPIFSRPRTFRSQSSRPGYFARGKTWLWCQTKRSGLERADDCGIGHEHEHRLADGMDRPHEIVRRKKNSHRLLTSYLCGNTNRPKKIRFPWLCFGQHEQQAHTSNRRTISKESTDWKLTTTTTTTFNTNTGTDTDNNKDDHDFQTVHGRGTAVRLLVVADRAGGGRCCCYGCCYGCFRCAGKLNEVSDRLLEDLSRSHV